MRTLEQWKPIQGYENYVISSLGNVKSLNYRQTGKEHFLKQHDYHGYLNVYLYKNGKRKGFLVHRLVGEAFIPNPDSLPYINHRDENGYNNCVSNLEWCTHEYNVNYGTRNVRAAYKNSLKQKNDPNKSTIIQCVDLNTNETTYYPSICEASRQLFIRKGNIHYCIYKSKKPYKNRYIFAEKL